MTSGNSDFQEHLAVLDGIFQQVPVAADRALCGWKLLDGKLLLTISNVARVWTAELGFEQFKTHRDKLCIRTMSWSQLFKMIVAVFGSDENLSLDGAPDDDSVIVLTLTYTLSGGLQLCGEFHATETTSEQDKAEALADIVFELLKRPPNIATQTTAREQVLLGEVNSLKARVEELQGDLERAREGAAAALPSWDDAGFSQYNSSQLDDGLAAAEAPKRRAPTKDTSLCNPQQKKRKTRGIKLGK